ncbi:hypothetical protein TTHERM_001086740 (macronuclear) [Tetrahymena thermophila SB210]|uniref:Uncharacterized protein n=1 Tax=Tetrahymena thermophila (strain SB210) TaxID=312017 RepID=W7X3P8_TETTS|nr:hypothetical protein TTHERM_001086740 [Tetrahymena thermophila SB210]EWS73940.1 hypothetical protein TTHERM_001086740 [Tetrahymena thermophila SB210]|eukprot:XP_012653521.1 hypothetical protein TTHERM_001086740 [Tetrahymena thermophila SB210]
MIIVLLQQIWSNSNFKIHFWSYYFCPSINKQVNDKQCQFFQRFSIIQNENQVITQQNYKILTFFVQHSMFQFRKTMFPISCTKGKKDQQSQDLSLRFKKVQNIYNLGHFYH